MLKQLLCSLQRFARMKENEVKKGFYTSEFAAALIQSYTRSMIKALVIIDRESYIRKVQTEADKLCVTIYSDYQSKFKLTRRRITRSKKRTGEGSSMNRALKRKVPTIESYTHI